MATDGVNFDAKFAAYERYLKLDAENLGLRGKKLGEQLGRYAVGLQYDAEKAAKKTFGKSYGKELAVEKQTKRNEYIEFWKKALAEKDVQDAKKAEVRKRILKNKGAKSGVVKADEIAAEKIKAYRNEAKLADLEKKLAYEQLKLQRFKNLAAHKGEISGVVKADEIAAVKIAENAKKSGKLGNMFKGVKGKYAIAGAAAALLIGGGIALFGGKNDKKSEIADASVDSIDEKLNDVKDNVPVIPVQEKDEAEHKEAAQETTSGSVTTVVPAPVVVPGEKDEGTVEEDVDATPSKEEVQETVVTPSEDETSNVKPEEKQEEVVAEEPVPAKPQEQIEPDDTVSSLQAKIRQNKAENRIYRAQIKNIRAEDRAVARQKRLEEFQAEQEASKVEWAEQKAIKDAERAERKAERKAARQKRLEEFQAEQEASKAEWAEQKAIKDAERAERKAERKVARQKRLEEFQAEQEASKAEWAEQKAIKDAKRAEQKAINAEIRAQRQEYRQNIKAIRQQTKEAIRDIRLQTKKDIMEYKLSQSKLELTA